MISNSNLYIYIYNYISMFTANVNRYFFYYNSENRI